MSFLIFRGSGVRFAIPSMPCGLILRVETRQNNTPLGDGGKMGKSTFLVRVKNFYFFPILG